MRRGLLTFTLEGELYGLPAHVVRETLRRCLVTRLPGLPSHVRGVLNLRGNVIAVLDVGKILGMPYQGRAKQDLYTAIVVHGDDAGAAGYEGIALVVDEVRDILFEGDYPILPAPANTPEEALPFIEGIAVGARETIVVLNAKRLLEHEERKDTESR